MTVIIGVGLITSGISVYHLRTSNRTTEGWEQKYRATVTVAILTSLAFVCNLTYLTAYVWNVLLPNSAKKPDAHYYHAYFRVIIMTIPLNSMINPLVYVARKREMRKFLWLLVRCKNVPVEPVAALPSH